MNPAGGHHRAHRDEHAGDEVAAPLDLVASVVICSAANHGALRALATAHRRHRCVVRPPPKVYRRSDGRCEPHDDHDGRDDEQDSFGSWARLMLCAVGRSAPRCRSSVADGMAAPLVGAMGSGGDPLLAE